MKPNTGDVSVSAAPEEEDGASVDAAGEEDDGLAPLTVDHVVHSVGGKGGHVARRVIHLGMLILPLLYYWGGTDLAESMDLDRRQLISLVGIGLVLTEALRLRSGITVFGQRAYEAHQVSAFGWGGISICIVFLVAPDLGTHGAAIGLPLVWTLSLVDPLMGELRRAGQPRNVVMGAAFAAAAVIWVVAAVWLGTPWWIIPLIVPVQVIAETPRLKWIDDNATMLLIPLAVVVLLTPWL